MNNIIEKIKHIVIIFISLLWITFFACLCCTEHGDDFITGGLGVNGFICFLLWLGFLFVIIKISPILADIGFTILYIVIRIGKFGINKEAVENVAAAVLTIGIFAALALAYFKQYRKERRESNERRIKNQNEGKNCCPRCGRTTINYIQPHLEKKYYGSSEYQYTLEQVNGYWQCTTCKHIWSDDDFSFF